MTAGRSVGLGCDSPSESVLKMPDREFTLGLLSGVDLLDGGRREWFGLVCELPFPASNSASFLAQVFPHVGNERLRSLYLGRSRHT